MNKDVIKTLVKARKLVEKGWTKNHYAKGANGRAVEWKSPDACQFCAVGALAKSCGGMGIAEDSDAATYLDRAMTDNGILLLHVPSANDARSTTQLHVLMAYDFAILMAKDDMKAASK